MIAVLLLGALFGLGLWTSAVWLVPPRPALGVVLACSGAPPPPPILTADDGGWVASLGRPFVGPLHAIGMPSARLRRDLAVLGRSVSAQLAQQATLALAGLLTPVLAQLLLVVTGIPLDLSIPILAAMALASAGFLVPDLLVRAEARRVRTGFRHALSAYLDLVWITLAGGAGVDSALRDSVIIGQGWAFTQLERALEAARLTRTTPWTTLHRLGEELDIAELSELAASVSLAGTEGAKVRQSLAAKASALRAHQLTEAEGAAQAATERMSLPVMVLMLGFLTFIIYPALTQVLNGL